MAVGNYLAIRSHESVLEAQNLPEEEAAPLRHAMAMFLAFVVAGTVPLGPYNLARLADGALRVISGLNTGGNVRGRCIARAERECALVEGRFGDGWR
jgi:hypothetical protein